MNIISSVVEKLRDPEYRKAFVASQINVGIPFQIRALLKARGKTQGWLAEKTGMLQPRISGLMNPGKTRPNIETLRRIAEAFDCGLGVRFVPFTELAGWSEKFDPESFNVPDFNTEVQEQRRTPGAAAYLLPASVLHETTLGSAAFGSGGTWDHYPAFPWTLTAGQRIGPSRETTSTPIQPATIAVNSSNSGAIPSPGAYFAPVISINRDSGVRRKRDPRPTTSKLFGRRARHA